MSYNDHKPIHSFQDLKREEKALRQRIRIREEQLQAKLNHIPGELFYSGVDNILPNLIKGRVSNFALGAGRGLINTLFLKRSPLPLGPLKVLSVVKPSGLLRKAGAGIAALLTRKKK